MIVDARGLSREFRIGRFGRRRTVVAVDGIDLGIEPGEAVGFLGPNGAGKSTTIKMLTGILVPNGGSVVVDGLVPWRQRTTLAARIGVVFGQRTQLWWDLPLIESLRLLHHIYKVPEGRYCEKLARLTDLLDLGPFLDRPVRQLSLGQRMRGDLAAAMLHEPPLLCCHRWYSLPPLFVNCSSRPSQLLISTTVAALAVWTWVSRPAPRASAMSGAANMRMSFDIPASVIGSRATLLWR